MDILKALCAALAGIAGLVMTATPSHTIAYKVAAAVIGLSAGGGLVSSGLTPKNVLGLK